MDLTAFFSAYPGIHVVQAFLHSLTAVVIADRAIAAWEIKSPVVTQKFHLVSVLAPVLSYPFYQWLNPDRGSLDFRLGALLDSGRWLNLELWGTSPGVILFVLLLAGTTAIFVVQELVPILRHKPGPEDPEAERAPPAAESPVTAALGSLPVNPPPALVVHDNDPAIHSVTGGSPVIYLTTGLVRSLEPDELRAALAHEVAHIARSRRPLLIVAYAARVLLFFSPGTLVGFRRAADDEEKICDDWAARVTEQPRALAAALEKLRHGEAYAIDDDDRGDGLSAIERISHDLMVRERIRRLEHGESAPAAAADWVKFAITLAAILVLNYYIV